MQLFKDKICNRDGRELAWVFHDVKLIEKKPYTLRLAQFRPIAILSSIYKWYSILGGFLAGLALVNLKTPQFAFHTSYQVTEVTFITTQFIEKTIEHGISLFIADGDISKAYDFTEHLEVIKGCDTAGVHRALTAAWIREPAGMEAMFMISARTHSDRIARIRSLIQGDPSAPALFNLAIDVPTVKFEEECKRRKWGFDMDVDILVRYLQICVYID